MGDGGVSRQGGHGEGECGGEEPEEREGMREPEPVRCPCGGGGPGLGLVVCGRSGRSEVERGDEGERVPRQREERRRCADVLPQPQCSASSEHRTQCPDGADSSGGALVAWGIKTERERAMKKMAMMQSIRSTLCTFHFWC
jgi:hypothetical protein